ncbi:Ras-related protein Rap-2a [Folsomia candida]|uniref:Ras-related protein Rap-2a n=1 Tax=Folsomia candida TaxID=158441 RepID=A0A226DF30_FOLCA|nr:Ras-related protein Rap-2a [Folsomia candida]
MLIYTGARRLIISLFRSLINFAYSLVMTFPMSFGVDLEHQREVSKHEGAALAQLWGCSFIETSAKQRTNVNDVFAEVVREMNCRPTKNKQSYCCSCNNSCCIL